MVKKVIKSKKLDTQEVRENKYGEYEVVRGNKEGVREVEQIAKNSKDMKRRLLNKF